MDDSGQDRLADRLRERQGAIADAWYSAVARTSFVPYSPPELRRRFIDLTEQAISLLFDEPFEAERAQQIGASLASFHYTQPEALGRTLSVLPTELSLGLATDRIVALRPRIAALIEGMATGYSRETTRILLLEQEAIRRALLTELGAAQRELVEARDHLEEQVAKRTEELLTSEQKYRDLLKEIDAAVFTVDRAGLITYASPPVSRLFGQQPSEVVGKPFFEFVHATDRPHVLEQFSQVLEGGKSSSEFRVPTDSGELRWAHASTSPVHAMGQVIAAHGVVTDITERKSMEVALKESEERWRSLVSNAPDSVLTLDPAGRIQFVNHLPPESGIAPQDLLGLRLSDIVVPEHHEVVEAAHSYVFETGGSTVFESAIQRPSGAVVWYAVHMGPVWQEGHVAGAMLIFRNITERRAAEQALQESEERWRSLVTSAPDLIYTVDSQGRMTLVNRLPTDSGLAPQDVTGRSICDYVLLEHRETVKAALRQVFSTGTSARYEAAVRRPNGEVVWYASSLGPLWHEGTVAAAMLISRDVTGRKQMEAALLESEERWRTLVSSAPDVIFTLAPGGRIVFVNHFPADSPFNPRTVIGRCLHELTVPEQVESGRAAIQRVFDTGLSCRLEVRVPRAGGREQWYSAVVGPLWHGDTVASAIVIARDITEQRKIEEMKDNLLRDVSHELRTPLTKAQVSLEMVLERLARSPVDRASAAKYGRMALENVQRLTTTLGGILDLSRLEAGVGGFVRERIHLPDLLIAVARETEPICSDKGLMLVVQVDGDLPAVRGDREKLSRVLRNLIDNACKFSSRGQVVVAAERQPDEIVISVSDEGYGILPENLERVFDRFFREDPGSAGIGVGLSMCKTIVQAHGGRIWAESAGRESGSTVRFALPVPDEDGTTKTG